MTEDEDIVEKIEEVVVEEPNEQVVINDDDSEFISLDATLNEVSFEGVPKTIYDSLVAL